MANRVEKKKYFDYGQKASDHELNSLELRLKKEYEQASKEVTQKMNKHLNDFYRKDEDRRKLVDMGEWTQQDYIEWRQGQLYIAGRWSELSNSIAQDYVNTNKIASQMITENNYDVFALNHNYGAFEIDSAMNYKSGASWTLYDRKTVENLAKGNKKLPLQTKVNVPKDFKWNKKQIESAMMQSILQGESIDKIAKRLPLAVGEKNLNGATRRARTLTTYAENAGRMDAYREAEEMGIEMQKCWIATLDNRTRDSHAIIDGECVDVDDEFSNGLMCPGDENGDPSEVYNCRCTMVAQVKGYEVDVTDIENRNIDHLESDYETWYSNHTPYEWEDTEEVSLQVNQTTIPTPTVKSEVLEACENSGIEYNEVAVYDKTPSEQEIIDNLGGGDLTRGSCSSLAFAYCGNKNGYEVTDFRGGDSQTFFSRNGNIRKIAELPGVDGKIVKHTNDFTGAHQLLKEVQEGKEYYFATGKHAAMVRKTKNGHEYLELQSATSNGWKSLTDYELKWRFGCQKSHSSYGYKYECSSELIDSEKLKNNDNFPSILGYINTDKGKQKKGIKGYVR